KISGEARELFNEASSMMLSDHPMGVGINNYSYIVSEEGYSERVGLPEVDANGIVHNIYWLTAAELGWHGFVAYILMLLAPLLLAAKTAWRARKSILGDLAFSLGFGLLLFDVQGVMEWASRQPTLLYVYWIGATMVAGIARQAGVLQDARR
ncbi:MAG: hypothetical protein KC416_11465, partial [Myxococcales bacterium]|nr:hypothetical protein [Myxococcales bacterium]